jgi:phosphoglycolate phosphatase
LASQRDTLILDLDGTLVDTAADLARALNGTIAEFGRGPLPVADVRAMIGGGIAHLVQQGLEATGGPLADDSLERAVAGARQRYGDHVADLSRPYPEVAETLEALAAKGVRMGVCTNKPEEASRRLLDALGLARWLPVVVGGDTLEVHKPDPAMARAVLDALGAAADEALAVGDSATDVALARAAGLPIVLVDYGYTLESARSLGADAVISRFGEIAGHLAAVS